VEFSYNEIERSCKKKKIRRKGDLLRAARFFGFSKL